MLKVEIPAREIYDERKNEFIYLKPISLALEHSLVSISKWEEEFKVPFLDEKEKTYEQTIFYIKCMTITQNVDDSVYEHIPKSVYEQITEYIKDSRTATWFREDQLKRKPGQRRETVTSELIYYWMIAYNIPVKFEKWHINRLITLIKICEIKNTPPKKMSKKELMRRNNALNESRKRMMGTTG